MKALIIIALIVSFALNIFQYTISRELELKVQQQREYITALAHRTEAVIIFMEYARDMHQFYADYPQFANWIVKEGQEEEWVEIYDEVISILKQEGES